MGQYNSEARHRRSIRLEGYDYSTRGVYFVTVCTQHRVQMFGEVVDGVMHVNERGATAQRLWDTLPARFPGTELDAFIVMPNHIHGILVRTRRLPGPTYTIKMQAQELAQAGGTLSSYRTHPRRTQMLSEIVRTFKAVTSYTIRKSGCSAFAWHREYYESIIRDEQQLAFVRSYIANNPATWQDDKLHPNMFKPDMV